MDKRKIEFWWASVYGADPEPVEKAELNGRPCVFTSGCDDPFYLDADPPAVLLITEIPRPLHPDKTAAREASIGSARKRKLEVSHGWRGPR